MQMKYNHYSSWTSNQYYNEIEQEKFQKET